MSSRNPVYKYDILQMYFGEPYVIDTQNTRGTITVLQPTIGDIIKIGEDKFYSNLGIFTSTTTQYRLMLWEQGIDWTQISDFELFAMMCHSLSQDVVDLLFDNICFQDFKLYKKNIDDEECLVLYDEKNNIEIDNEVYLRFSQYLRNVFKIFPEEINTDSKMLKEWYIAKDKRELAQKEKQSKKDAEEHKSQLQSVISSCVNHPGFKYKLQELREVYVCEFYDSVQRLQIYEQTTACLKGMYSGFVDGKKLKADDYNFMKDLKQN